MGATTVGLRRAPAGRRPVHLGRVVVRRIGAGLLRMGIRLRAPTPSLSPTWVSHSLGVSYRMRFETVGAFPETRRFEGFDALELRNGLCEYYGGAVRASVAPYPD